MKFSKGMIEKILVSYGLQNLKKSGDEIVCCCPFHKEENPSFSINTVTGKFICFSGKCGLKGDFFRFKSLMEGITYEEAKKELSHNASQFYYKNLIEESLEKVENNIDDNFNQQNHTEILEVKSLFDFADYDHVLKSINVSEEIARKIELSICMQKPYYGRLAIPIKNIAYKTAIPMLAAALVSIPIAVYFAAKVEADIFEILLGSVLIILSVYFLFFNKKIKIKPTPVNGIIAGTLGGALNGLFSTGGPPAVLYLTNAAPDNVTYFATIQFYFCLTNIYATANRAINGLVTADLLIYAAVGILGCLAGDLIGRKIFDKLDSVKLKYVIYIGMIISGALMLF